MNFATWQGATNCTGFVAPGAKHLLAWCRENFLTGWSMGIYNCRTVRGGATTSLHGEGRALDYGMPMLNNRSSKQGHDLVKALGSEGKRLGIQAIIYDRRIWSASSPTGRYYGGVHPHYDHLHIELTRRAGQELNLATLRAVLGSFIEEDDVFVIKYNQKDDRVKRAQRILQAAGQETFGRDLLLEYGPDGHYGSETAKAVNAFAEKARLPLDGETGMDVLILDYCRMVLEAARNAEYTAASTGLTREEADELYVERGHTITLE